MLRIFAFAALVFIGQAYNGLSVLKNVGPADLKLTPFPHIVKFDALDRKLYEELANSFPEKFLLHLYRGQKQNTRGDLFLNNRMQKFQAHRKAPLTQQWKHFLAYHQSKTFADELQMHFGENFISTQTICNTLKRHPKTISLHANIGINTPVVSESVVRGPHVDKISKYYSGLFYMRAPSDNSTGGDLQLCDKHSSLHIGATDCSAVLVQYRANTLVIFPTSPDAMHAVTARSITKFPRRFVNLYGAGNCRQQPPPIHERLRRRYGEAHD